MAEISLTTPALLFSAVSLILLAYTNRFLAYAGIVRSLHAEYRRGKDRVLLGQIQNLRRRLNLTRWMQFLGVLSLFLSMGSMLFFVFALPAGGVWTFCASLLFMIASLGISVWEIQISVVALNLHLEDMEDR